MTEKKKKMQRIEKKNRKEKQLSIMVPPSTKMEKKSQGHVTSLEREREREKKQKIQINSERKS